MQSARTKVVNIHMGQLQGQIPAEKQYGYVMEQNIIQKVIIKPRLVVRRALLIIDQKQKESSNLIIVKISSHL